MNQGVAVFAFFTRVDVNGLDILVLSGIRRPKKSVRNLNCLDLNMSPPHGKHPLLPRFDTSFVFEKQQSDDEQQQRCLRELRIATKFAIV